MASAPISLYLDLEDGQLADLEVVSRAAIAFSRAIKDAAYIIDPSLEIRIDFVSGTEGSLSLNNLISNLKQQIKNPKTLLAVAMLALQWFGTDIRGYITDNLLDQVFGVEREAMTQSDKDEIAAIVAKAVSDQLAQEHVKDVYKTLETDPAIKGVGASAEHRIRPDVIIPRSEFSARSKGQESLAAPSGKRSDTIRTTLTLVKPVLASGNRPWRFLSEIEFSAYILDTDTLDSILQGRVQIPMISGIQMDVDLEIIEAKIDGIWQIQRRNILKIHGFKNPKIQESLMLPNPPPRNKGSNSDTE